MKAIKLKNILFHGSANGLLTLRHLLFPVLVSLLAALTPAWAIKFSAEVIDVADGDTITVAHKLRLADIDCPEKTQDCGDAAKQYTTELVHGKTVLVNISGEDRYKRSIGSVELADGRNLNRELVRAGLAWCYDKYCNDLETKDLEAEARQERRGLWVAENPAPPWRFRQEQRGRTDAQVPTEAEPSEPFSSNSILAQKPADNKSKTVVFNTKSHVYHDLACSFAIRCTKNCISLSLSEATARGGRPCKYCGGGSSR